jgi:16S rRNA (guanine(1405)-N(7))-methyltransferase
MPADPGGEPLDRLVAAVLDSPKYAAVSEAFVRRVGGVELAKRRNLKDAIKATKNKLHQVGGAYLSGDMQYAEWLDDLRAAGDSDGLRAVCRTVMAHHASTRERLTVLDTFFAETLASLAPVRSVIDVACGLNPLAAPWMPLAPGATYTACDIYTDMLAFVGDFLALAGFTGRAAPCDVSGPQPDLPSERADVALILKTIPCLEQVDKAAGLRLLDAVDAAHVLVSFPVRSLGGYNKGMVEHYEARLGALLAERGWPVTRFAFETELAFLVDKNEA